MNFFKTTTILVILTFTLIFSAFAQTGEPRQESLLNGLKILTWTDAKAEKTTVKIRVHSGSAFDPKDRMGVMALLTDILFPTEQTKEFFEQDLEGSLEVTSNYEYIQISATGKSDEFITILETLATAITNLQPTQENFLKVREARLKTVQELQKNPNYVADKAVAKKLLSDFPYGRPTEGTPESLAKIDRVDLIFAKDKFFTADNATIAIIGNAKADYVLRATRRYFGGWKKSENRIPATFALPNDPDTKKQIINSDLVEQNAVRYAFRGVARNDKDFFATRFLFDILKNREVISNQNINNYSIKHERNLLPSLAILGVSNLSNDIITANESAKTVKDLFGNKLFAEITNAEFEKTKTQLLSEIAQKLLIDKSLDIETYRLISVKDEMQKLNSVTIADVQRVADRLSKQNFVTVILAKPMVQ